MENTIQSLKHSFTIHLRVDEENKMTFRFASRCEEQNFNISEASELL